MGGGGGLRFKILFIESKIVVWENGLVGSLSLSITEKNTCIWHLDRDLHAKYHRNAAELLLALITEVLS